MPGPAPIPANIRILSGRHLERVNRDAPVPRDLPPGAPEWLSQAAAAEWERIAPDLVAMGTAKAVDAAALGAYCEAVARLQMASRAIAQLGLMVPDRDGVLHKNPAMAQARDASVDVRMWAREFGFTPSARSGIKVVHEVQGDAARLLSNG